MKNTVSKQIQKIVSQTKVHKDSFAIPQLIALLESELQDHAGSREPADELVIKFVEKSVDALLASPIYSATLVTELYRNVLDLAAQSGISRESLVEDLLFQSLRRPAELDKTKRRRQTNARARILTAALEEFSEKGFHNATIDSMAERAGIAKGTVYRYFKTKEQLFNALKEDTIGEFVEMARKKISTEDDILTILEQVIENYLAFFQENSALFKVIIQEHSDFGREFSEKFINELILAFPNLKRRCWKASRNGVLKQMNYFTVFFGIIGFLNGVIHKWLLEGGEASLISEAETVKEVLFYGFAVHPDLADRNRSLKVIS